MFEVQGNEGSVGPGTVVGANVKLTGTISDVNDITIHGVVEGEVISDKTVIIAETATVKGPVTAQIVSVSGKVNGAVTAYQKLELLPSGQINGSINTKELIIKSGATFNGKCTMNAQEELDRSAKTAVKGKEVKDKSEEKEEAEPEEVQKETLGTAPTFELEE